MNSTTLVGRREFLKISSSAGAGLVLGFWLPASAAAVEEAAFQPNAWLQVTPAGQVKIWVGKCELGQGVRTSLPMIVAEELEADWVQVEVVQGIYDKKYGEQGTGGSTSVRTSWAMLRKAGATAREMLLEVAAQRWKVEKSACRAEKGRVIHAASNRRLTFGQLASAAAKLPVPQDAPLKDPKNFRVIGVAQPQRDAPARIEGRAVFGLDVRRPGMLFATVARCPVFDGKVANFDASKARHVPDVRHVVQIASGIAVVAENTWAAIQGREALEVTWREGPGATESSASLRKQFEELTAQPGKVFRNDGDVDAALSRAAKRVDAVYELPFLAHASMEPGNCTAHVQKDRCEVWAPTQSPEWVHGAAQRITGLPPEAIRVNVVLAGGAFGRRWFPSEAADAVEISKLVDAPVQVVWTRADDLQHGFYRPASYHRMSAGLDAAGWPVAWLHRYASTSILGSFQPQAPNPEAMELEGAVDFPYGVPSVRVEYAPAMSAAPRGWLRSVSHTFTAFVVQSFLDELAAAARKDPLEFRLALLREPRKIPVPGGEEEKVTIDTQRLRRVLEVAAEKAGWGKAVPKGHGLGLAHHCSFYTYVAEVAEVSVARDATVRVERVVCAVDCGTPVNPQGVRAQLEGGVVYGLSAALKSAITLDRGRVEQSNFHDYDVVRLAEAPTIEVHIVPSSEPPTGVGEPGVPPIAPAVTNAIFAAIGKRIRRLPIRAADLA
jgi:isoquinoline 1-oxidoreductase beta subunit